MMGIIILLCCLIAVCGFVVFILFLEQVRQKKRYEFEMKSLMDENSNLIEKIYLLIKE